MKIKFLLRVFLVAAISVIASSGDAQWTAVYPQNCNGFAIVGNEIFAAGYDIFVGSVDSGRSWFSLSAPPATSIRSIAGNESILFEASYTGLFQSTNSGGSWVMSSYPYNSYQPLAVRDSTILVGGYGRSPDNGKSWSSTNLNLISNVLIQKDTAFFAGTDSGVFRSTDDGITWTLASSGIPGGIDGLTLSGQTLFASSVSGHIYSSSDDGDSWVRMDTGSGLVNVEFLAAAGGALFGGVGGHAGYISGSLDKGISWRVIGGMELANTIITFGNYILVGTNFQIFRSSLLDLFVSDVKNSTSYTSISLSPNPATGILSIRNAPENLANISILNVLGVKVMDIAGPHSSDFTIDLSNLPAGIYDVVFRSANSVEVKKIIKQ